MRNFALYEAAKAADEAFQAELIRVYGVKKACEMRYSSKPYHSAELNELSAAKRSADVLWLAEMRKEIKELAAKISEYLETLDDTCPEEWYCTERELESGTFTRFLKWLQEFIPEAQS